MQRVLRNSWITACIIMLCIGIVLAVLGDFSNDVGLGIIWYLAMNTLVFPLGLVGFFTVMFIFALVEKNVLGPDMHFSQVAYVCITWTAMMLCGYFQWFKLVGMIKCLRDETQRSLK